MSPPAHRSADSADLGSLAPTGLVDARRQLHHALQLVASAARSFAEPQADDMHANLGWMPGCWALVTRPLGTWEAKPRVALRLDVPTVALLGPDEGTCLQLPVSGRIRTEVAGWLRAQMALRELNAASYLLDRPYEIPHHPVADGKQYFEAHEVARGTCEELARWFALAMPALQVVAAREENASDVRCWPHHFDVATLITLNPEASGKKVRTVGVGMSPGDDGIAQPYFYVTPWPVPAEGVTLPELPLGTWNTEGWTGALLTAEALLAAIEPKAEEGAEAGDEQEPAASASAAEHLQAFLDAAIPAVRALLQER